MMIDPMDVKKRLFGQMRDSAMGGMKDELRKRYGPGAPPDEPPKPMSAGKGVTITIAVNPGGEAEEPDDAENPEEDDAEGGMEE